MPCRPYPAICAWPRWGGRDPWQTAIRVIIPTAMSGLFSAVMIGLGRRRRRNDDRAHGGGQYADPRLEHLQRVSDLVGEHRHRIARSRARKRALSNIVRRALALFVITFVVNTVAEAVRLRFRRRAYEL